MENLDIEYTDIDYFEIVVTKTYSNKRIDRLFQIQSKASHGQVKKLIDQNLFV